MSEDAEAERKAKAARAKALLAKKRKDIAKKAAASGSTPTASIAPSSPVSTIAAESRRTSLSLDEAPREVVATETSVPPASTSTSGDAAASVVDDTGEAPKVESQRSEVFKAEVPRDQLGAAAEITAPTSDALPKLQETISHLLAERTDLQNQIQTLQKDLTAAKADSKLLAEGRSLISTLEGDKQALEGQVRDLEGLRGELEGWKNRVGGLQSEIKGLQAGKEELERTVQEAEEKRKAELGRLGELEMIIERGRQREGGLEAEVGRLKSANADLMKQLTDLKSELETLQQTHTSSSSTLTALQTTCDDLIASHKSLQDNHAQLQTAHSELQAAHNALTTAQSSSSSSLSTTQASLATAQSDLASSKASLATMTKRAETAEKKRNALQLENGDLVSQLGEVRGKVVDIMEEKVDLIARVESLESKLKLSASELDEAKRTVSELETRAQVGATATAANDNDGEDADAEAEKALLISSQAEKIRSLEASLHASTSRIHALTKHVSDLEQTQSHPHAGLEERRPPLQGRIPSGAGMDAILPESVRHKRQVSLAGLKARMEPKPPSLGRRTSSQTNGHGGASGLDTIPAAAEDENENGENGAGDSTTKLANERTAKSSAGAGTTRGARTQFGDEIMFCCPACEGDLITL